MEVIGNENAVITMIVVFALVIGPLSGVWNLLLSRIVGGGAHETFFLSDLRWNHSSFRSYCFLYRAYFRRNQVIKGGHKGRHERTKQKTPTTYGV